MGTLIASASIIFGLIAAMYVFIPFFKTPPTPIVIFSVLGLIAGMIGIKEARGLSTVGLVLSAASIVYLIYLFIQLGG